MRSEAGGCVLLSVPPLSPPAAGPVLRGVGGDGGAGGGGGAGGEGGAGLGGGGGGGGAAPLGHQGGARGQAVQPPANMQSSLLLYNLH